MSTDVGRRVGEERESVWQTTQWAVGPPRASSHTRPHTSCGRAAVNYHIKSKERRREREREREKERECVVNCEGGQGTLGVCESFGCGV